MRFQSRDLKIIINQWRAAALLLKNTADKKLPEIKDYLRDCDDISVEDAENIFNMLGLQL